ncbi:hypothetical protein Ancab_030485 [Ancistrocladus abbreviatus]
MENSSSKSTPSQSSTANKAFSGIASVVKLLPTGTVFVFMFLSPVVSNNGKSHHANKIMTAILVGVCGLCCALASFTDSYIDKSGKIHYGIVTTKGLLTFDLCEDKMEMEKSKYKLGLADFVHAGLCLVVFVPILSNNGQCELVNKILTAILIAACGFSCALASFTDSYTDKNGKTHYGIVTTKRLWTFDDSDLDIGGDKEASQYKLRFADFVHAGFSLLVFSVVTILNSNTVDCFYPSLEAYENTLVAVLPAVISAVASLVFMLFPLTRHGIGSNPNSSTSGQSTGR